MFIVNNSTSINNLALSLVTSFQSCCSQPESGLSLLEIVMRTCKIEGCANKCHGNGFCWKHYIRVRRYGDPLYVKIERHGLINTSEYNIWQKMKSRCYNKKNNRYYRYGGRGITVCERWRNSFTTFFADMGKKPFSKAQIDRIDNNGNYEPGNCRWATNVENIRNSSATKLSFDKADRIRKEYKKGGVTQKELGLRHDVRSETIGDIIRNNTWIN